MANNKEPTRRITDKQDRYARELALGKTQRVAYRIAYPSSIKWLDATVDSKASVLFKNEKVLARYNELTEKVREKVEEEFLVSASDIIKSILEIREDATEKLIIRENEEEGIKIYSMKDRFSALKANEMLGKHINFFTPKVELTANINIKDINKEIKEATKKVWEDVE